MGKRVRMSYEEWVCGEKAIGFVKEHLEEHKKENHATVHGFIKFLIFY